MDPLIRARRPVRREFNTLHKQLEDLLKETPLKVDVINVTFKLFSDTFEVLSVHDGKVLEEMVNQKSSEKDEDEEYNEIRDFKSRAETLRQLKDKLVPQPPLSLPQSIPEGGSEIKVRNFKLPTIQIQKFSGDLKDWLGFWAQFQKIDEDKFMHGSDKFWYLLQSLQEGTEAFEIVANYPQSNENYPKVIEALQKRFGNHDILLQVYIRELLGLVIGNVSTKDKTPIRGLFLKLDSHLRALKTLQLERADPATWLFPLVESCLPEESLHNWHRSELSKHDGSKDDPPRTRLDLLMSFLEKEVEIRQRIELARSFAGDRSTDKQNKAEAKENKDRRSEKRGRVPALAAFHVGDSKGCVFCTKNSHTHASADCYRAEEMTYEDKMKILKEKGLCYRCCGAHMGRDCRSDKLECGLCKRRHITVLCRDMKPKKRKRDRGQPSSKKPRVEADAPPTSSSANLECSREVALQTVIVKLVCGGKAIAVRAFIDSGSQRSYILKSTAKRLGAEACGVERVVHALFGGKKTSTLTHNKYKLIMKSLDGGFSQMIEVREHEQLCAGIPRITYTSKVFKDLQEKGIELTDTGEGVKEIGLLLGADLYAKIVTGSCEKLSSGAVAIHTKLGWTVLGSVDSCGYEDSIANLNLTMSVVDASVAQLWELDALGIKDSVEQESKQNLETEIREKFAENIRKIGDRYSVNLPWKEDHPFLPSNREVAFKRLQAASKKLVDTGMFETYAGLFCDWEKEGFIERVPAEETEWKSHYVPHRPVIKPESATTPVRPVFDASCRVGRSPSLNDCLHKGENYVQLIPEIMQRFREKPIAFVADIRKAFLMIAVEPKDRDFMRFLWWENKEMREVVEFRHARVMFGANCSPFILGAVLFHHLTNLPEDIKEFGAKLFSTLYVDNCVHSAETVAEYEQFRELSVELMSKAGMELRVWMSTVDGFEEDKNNVISVLGLKWDRRADELYVEVKGVKFPEKATKRSLLSVVQKIFDPMGFLSPALLPMKLLLQKAWGAKLKWDEELPGEMLGPFRKWCEEIHNLAEIRIPRLATGGNSRRSNWSLHTFVDASKDAYGAAVFLRVESGIDVSVQLLASKSRVSPVKRMTIPKLELMGCLVGARLARSVKSALEMETVKEHYWTDSSTALAWITRNSQWSIFVANRRKEINLLTKLEDWHHIPGSENPADLPSRGCLPSKLLQLRWWEGPRWLTKQKDDWPKSEVSVNEEEVLSELRATEKVQTEVTFSIMDSVKTQHSFAGMVRIVAYVRRFIHNSRANVKERREGHLSQSCVYARKIGRLSPVELEEAERIFLRDIQREEFPMSGRQRLVGLELLEDEFGLLRVKTRLTHSDEVPGFKYPILLPSKRPEVKQLIRDYHVSFCHAGPGFLAVKLRQRFWLLKCRQTIKNVISKCPRCRRHSAKAALPAASPLPPDRIKDSEVWEVTGIDLAGPLFLKNGKKVWLVIFTCAVYRAVHFEIVSTLSTRGFICTLNNFVKRFRRPTVIYSDNGTNFRGAENLFKKLDWDEIQKKEGVTQITWRFNPVTASWWGGMWEVLIRVAKNMLKRTLGKQCVSRKELESVMESVSEAMNARPLTYISENQLDLEPLSPSLFLHPFGNVKFPEGELTEGQMMRFRYKYVAKLKEELRNRFVKEYLALLVNRHPKKPTRKLVLGEMVLIGSDNRKRLDWPLGRILELIPGKDGICRVARVKIESGECIRPIQRLYPLELDVENPYQKPLKEKAVVTRAGRIVKPPVRFL